MLENLLIGLKNKKLSHFIYVSSDAVYSDSSMFIDEQSKNDKQFIKQALKININSIFFIPKKFLNDLELVLYHFDSTHN